MCKIKQIVKVSGKIRINPKLIKIQNNNIQINITLTCNIKFLLEDFRILSSSPLKILTIYFDFVHGT